MNKLIEALEQESIVQRIHELETYIDSNQTLKDKISELKTLQKKVVHAKEFHQLKQYAVYQKEYDILYQNILDYPFVEEYLELLEEANQILLNITNIIELKINQKINE